MHLNFTPEYTLVAMLAGTFSLVEVPELQGLIEAVPKASAPIKVTLVGRVTLVRLSHVLKAELPIEETPVGMLMLDRTRFNSNA